jgi:hypothetical protein
VTITFTSASSHSSSDTSGFWRRYTLWQRPEDPLLREGPLGKSRRVSEVDDGTTTAVTRSSSPRPVPRTCAAHPLRTYADEGQGYVHEWLSVCYKWTRDSKMRRVWQIITRCCCERIELSPSQLVPAFMFHKIPRLIQEIIQKLPCYNVKPKSIDSRIHVRLSQ